MGSWETTLTFNANKSETQNPLEFVFETFVSNKFRLLLVTLPVVVVVAVAVHGKC